jgi:hypothetical protein
MEFGDIVWRCVAPVAQTLVGVKVCPIVVAAPAAETETAPNAVLSAATQKALRILASLVIPYRLGVRA